MDGRFRITRLYQNRQPCCLRYSGGHARTFSCGGLQSQRIKKMRKHLGIGTKRAAKRARPWMIHGTDKAKPAPVGAASPDANTRKLDQVEARGRAE